MSLDYSIDYVKRLEKMEAEQENRRDYAEDEIFKLIGKVSPETFYKLRALFEMWQEADETMALATERLSNLN